MYVDEFFYYIGGMVIEENKWQGHREAIKEEITKAHEESLEKQINGFYSRLIFVCGPKAVLFFSSINEMGTSPHLFSQERERERERERESMCYNF